MKLAFTLDLGIYPFDLRVSFGESDKAVSNWLKKKGEEDHDKMNMDASMHGLCFMFGSGIGVIRMKKIPETVYDFNVLQHEITHYVMFLLFHTLDMPHNLDTTEAYSYLTGWITEQIYKKLPKFK